MNKNRVLKTKDLPDILGIGINKAYDIMRSKTFPSVKIGKNYFVTEENLYKWLNANSYKTIKL